MRKFTCFFAIGFLLGGAHGAALACDASYDTTAQVAWLPCVGIQGGTQVFSVSLAWTGGNNYVLTSSEEYGVENPRADSLKIITSPLPVAIVFGHYSSGCFSAYGSPSYVLTGNNIDIRVKARYSLRSDIACTQALVPFAELVTLPLGMDTRSYTYSVNGVSITPGY